jgi:hypothetical protein
VSGSPLASSSSSNPRGNGGRARFTGARMLKQAPGRGHYLATTGASHPVALRLMVTQSHGAILQVAPLPGRLWSIAARCCPGTR